MNTGLFAGLVLVAAFAGIVAGWPAVGSAGEYGVTMEPDFSFDSGDYGGGDTIRTMSFSVTADYEFAPAWTLSLTIVPYLYQDESYSDVVLVAGRPVHHQDVTGSNPHHADPHHGVDRGSKGNRHPGDMTTARENDHAAGSGPESAGRGPVELSGQEAGTAMVEQEVRRHSSVSGIGDSFVDLSYRVLEQSDTLPEVSVHTGVKLPTADEDKGLGTGKIDYQAGVSVYREVGDWNFEAGIDYTVVGDPDDYQLNNTVSGYGEVTTMLTRRLEITTTLSAAQAGSDESDGELALSLDLSYDMERAGNFSVGVGKGLADGSPDYSMMVGYSISF